jgi:hypothetical protein
MVHDFSYEVAFYAVDHLEVNALLFDWYFAYSFRRGGFSSHQISLCALPLDMQCVRAYLIWGYGPGVALLIPPLFILPGLIPALLGSSGYRVSNIYHVRTYCRSHFAI